MSMLSPYVNLNIELPTVVVRASGKISADLPGETAILDPEKGLYFGLNEVGSRIWQHISSPRSGQEVCDLIIEEYEVDEAQCIHDVLALFTALDTQGLLERKIL